MPMDAVPAMDAIDLGFGFNLAELASRAGLVRLDRLFLDRLAAADTALHAGLLAARAAPLALAVQEESALVVALAPHLDAFVAALFGIEAETLALADATHALDPIHACKRLFVQRQAVKKYPDPSGFDGRCPARGAGDAVRRADHRAGLRRTCRRLGEVWRDRRARRRHALRRLGDADGGGAARRIPGNTLFRVPHRIDPQHLVPVETIERDGVTMLRLPEHHWRARDGFALTDPGMNPQQALDQINYCIWCHTQGKDSCRHGLKDRKTRQISRSRRSA